MSISVSEVLENAFAEWFEGDEFESREDFEEAVDRFTDMAIDEIADVGRSICKMKTEELADWLNVRIKNEEDESEDENE